jgi:hypothetical protein
MDVGLGASELNSLSTFLLFRFELPTVSALLGPVGYHHAVLYGSSLFARNKTIAPSDERIHPPRTDDLNPFERGLVA